MSGVEAFHHWQAHRDAALLLREQVRIRGGGRRAEQAPSPPPHTHTHGAHDVATAPVLPVADGAFDLGAGLAKRGHVHTCANGGGRVQTRALLATRPSSLQLAPLLADLVPYRHHDAAFQWAAVLVTAPQDPIAAWLARLLAVPGIAPPAGPPRWMGTAGIIAGMHNAGDGLLQASTSLLAPEGAGLGVVLRHRAWSAGVDHVVR